MTEALYRSHDIISNWKLKFSAYLVHVRFAQRNSNEWAYDDDEQQCGLAHDSALRMERVDLFFLDAKSFDDSIVSYPGFIGQHQGGVYETKSLISCLHYCT